VALVEALRVGGECPYVTCIPSKAMLRSAQARAEARRLTDLGGSSTPVALDSDELAYRGAAARRDRLSSHRDDTEAARGIERRGVELVRGTGRIASPGVIDAGGRQFGYRDLVVATGSRPAIPSIDGLDSVDAWTSDRALSDASRPGSVIILGAGQSAVNSPRPTPGSVLS
jgi:dihydrolipoamide dehydrogenase